MFQSIIMGIACLFVGSACSKVVRIDSAFAPYIQVFEETSVKYGKPIKIDNLVMIFNTREEQYAGVCYKAGFYDFQNTPLIEINEYAWKILSEEQKLNLILHELGHCILNRDHTTESKDGRPASLMYPSVFFPNIFFPNYDYYMEELYNG